MRRGSMKNTGGAIMGWFLVRGFNKRGSSELGSNWLIPLARLKSSSTIAHHAAIINVANCNYRELRKSRQWPTTLNQPFNLRSCYSSNNPMDIVIIIISSIWLILNDETIGFPFFRFVRTAIKTVQYTVDYTLCNIDQQTEQFIISVQHHNLCCPATWNWKLWPNYCFFVYSCYCRGQNYGFDTTNFLQSSKRLGQARFPQRCL